MNFEKFITNALSYLLKISKARIYWDSYSGLISICAHDYWETRDIVDFLQEHNIFWEEYDTSIYLDEIEGGFGYIVIRTEDLICRK